MSNIPKLGQGTIMLKLGNEELELKPTIHATQQICLRFGDIVSAMERVAKMDFNAVLDVIFLGLGPKFAGAKQRAAISEKVFAEGLTEDTGGIAFVVTKYLQSLARGGRPAPEKQAEIDEENEAEGAGKN